MLDLTVCVMSNPLLVSHCPSLVSLCPNGNVLASLSLSLSRVNIHASVSGVDAVHLPARRPASSRSGESAVRVSVCRSPGWIPSATVLQQRKETVLLRGPSRNSKARWGVVLLHRPVVVVRVGMALRPVMARMTVLILDPEVGHHTHHHGARLLRVPMSRRILLGQPRLVGKLVEVCLARMALRVGVVAGAHLLRLALREYPRTRLVRKRLHRNRARVRAMRLPSIRLAQHRLQHP